MALRAILDTRFFFSYFNPEDESVAKWSREVIGKAPELGISAITIVELYRSMGRIVGVEVIELRLASIRASGISVIPVTEEVARVAGKVALKAPNMPIADAIIAATALIHANGVVVTDDEHFKLLKDVKPKWLKEL